MEHHTAERRKPRGVEEVGCKISRGALTVSQTTGHVKVKVKVKVSYARSSIHRPSVHLFVPLGNNLHFEHHFQTCQPRSFKFTVLQRFIDLNRRSPRLTRISVVSPYGDAKQNTMLFTKTHRLVFQYSREVRLFLKMIVRVVYLR